MSTPALRLLFGWELPDSCLGQNSRHKVIVFAAIPECRPATTVTRFRDNIRARQCFRELMLNSKLAARPERLVDHWQSGHHVKYFCVRYDLEPRQRFYEAKTSATVSDFVTKIFTNFVAPEATWPQNQTVSAPP